MAGFVLHRLPGPGPGPDYQVLFHEQQTTTMRPKLIDVTLACNADQNIQTHVVILGAISPVQVVFKAEKKHSQPLVDLRGDKFNSKFGYWCIGCTC